MKRIREQKGITLIALIITIVVLLILAVVAIGAVKDSGIILHAQNAGSKYTEAQIKEKINLAISEAYMAGLGKIQEDSLRSALTTQFGSDFKLTMNGENYIVEVSGKKYKVSSTGAIDEHEEKLERVYYTAEVGGESVWAEEYVDSEEKVPNNARIIAKFYKTSTPLQPAFLEEYRELMPPIAPGYAYKLVIEGKGEAPILADGDKEKYYAWIKEINKFLNSEDNNGNISPIAFYITEAEIKGISNISSNMFAYAISLKNINISDEVKKIDYHAMTFAAIENLNFKNIDYIGDYAFSNSALKEVKIPDGITTLGESVFDCSMLERVDLNDVVIVGDGAFNGCESLVSVEIGDNTTTLGVDAFRFCDSLESIDLKNVNSFGAYAFQGDEKLKVIKIKASSLTEVANTAFNQIASGSKIYVLNEEVKKALEGKYNPDKTTVEIKTLEEMEQL